MSGFQFSKMGTRCLRHNSNARRFFKRLGFAEVDDPASQPKGEHSPLASCVKFERHMVRHRISGKSSV